MKKRIFASAVSVILCVCLAFGCLVPALAADNALSDLMGIINGSGSSGSINFGSWIQDLIKEDSNKESVIDKFVDNLKDKFTGSGDSNTEEDVEDENVAVEIDPGAAESVAELFNVTVNELKKGNPSFVKTTTATMDKAIAESLQGGLGVVTGLVESIIGTKDIFAGVLDGYDSESNTIIEYFEAGNDVVNNISVKGKDYVTRIATEDVEDYTVSIYSSGRYRIHIDLKDVEGALSKSGLANVFGTDTEYADKDFATIELGTTSLNINVKLKYTGCYVECSVGRRGNIESYTTHMGITFLFQQEDGTYSSVMPYFDVDFEKEGIIYTVTTDYSDFEHDIRLVGDADSDGKVNSSDARLILRAAAGLETISETAVPYSDVDGNGSLTAGDARLVLRASAMLEELPTTEELLGITQYEMDESVKNHIDDLLILLLAYQAVAEEEAKKQLEDSTDKNEKPTQEPTTGTINSTTEKVDDYIGILGGVLGGDFSSIGNLFK